VLIDFPSPMGKILPDTDGIGTETELLSYAGVAKW
jgi:hypothetical protein